MPIRFMYTSVVWNIAANRHYLHLTRYKGVTFIGLQI